MKTAFTKLSLILLVGLHTLGAFAQSPVLTFKGSEGTVNETDGTYELEILLSNANSNPTSVDIIITQNTATLGVDYNYSSPQSVTIPANTNTTEKVLVTIINNSTTDDVRTIEFRMQNPTNDASYGKDSTFLLSIIDDDLAVTQIQDITVNDADFVPTTENDHVRIKGVVYGVNLRSTGLQFTVIDNTGGIGVIDFDNDFGYNVRQGDEVTIQGYVDFWNGLTRIGDLDSVIFTNDQSTPKNPAVVTKLDETTESELIQIERVWFVNDNETEWPDNGNIDVTNGMDTFIIRIDNDVVDLAGQPTPIFDTMNIAGLGNQYDPYAPHNEGYQIFPRYAADITEWMAPGSVSTELLEMNLYPNPTKGLVRVKTNAPIDEIRVYNLTGVEVEPNSSTIFGQSAKIDLSSLSRGVYLIKVQTQQGVIDQKISLQ